jgi:hypothetical protein
MISGLWCMQVKHDQWQKTKKLSLTTYILKKVYTPATEQGVSRIGTNQELRELYKTHNVVIKNTRRLKWLGIVIILDQTSVERTILKVSQKV